MYYVLMSMHTSPYYSHLQLMMRSHAQSLQQKLSIAGNCVKENLHVWSQSHTPLWFTALISLPSTTKCICSLEEGMWHHWHSIKPMLEIESNTSCMHEDIICHSNDVIICSCADKATLSYNCWYKYNKYIHLSQCSYSFHKHMQGYWEKSNQWTDRTELPG